jgi:hypothetical protein
MKNLLVYHLVANGSTVIYLYPWLEGWISTPVFALFAFVHTFILHPIVDYYRLVELGKIEKGDFGKMWKWGTLYRLKYYSSLTFGV